MINLDTTTKSLEVVLGGSVTTNQLPFSASFIDVLTTDQSVSTISETDGATNNSTAVTMVAAPAASHTRTVRSFTVYNADTVNATVTIQINNNATLRTKFHVTLSSGDNLVYADGGFSVVTGVSVFPITVPNGGTGDTTLTAHGVLIGEATAAIAATSAGTSGQPLLSGGAGADPNWGTLSVAFGGTGDTTLTNHGVLLGQATSAVVATAVGATGTVLHGNTGADPSYSAVSLTADVTGTLPVANGGTGDTSLTAHGVLIGNATSAVAVTAVGATNTLLHGNTGADPTYSAVVEADLSLADNTTNDVSTSKHGFAEKRMVIATIALSDGATPALDASLGNVFRLAASGDRTIAVPSNAQAGQKIVIEHFASAAGRTLSLNSGAGGFRFGSDITSLTQTASGKTDYIGCIYNDTDSKWDVVAVTKGF